MDAVNPAAGSRLFLPGQAISLLGDGVAVLAIPLLVLQLTHNRERSSWHGLGAEFRSGLRYLGTSPVVLSLAVLQVVGLLAEFEHNDPRPAFLTGAALIAVSTPLVWITGLRRHSDVFPQHSDEKLVAP
ncbi:hypothetical protein [Nocardia sp. NBC_00403]|uniref:hypothetical protein n=1 Tax=Nocardia sp. NBC_00403 TaxID=2975990 RepID=UPI002E22FAB1